MTNTNQCKPFQTEVPQDWFFSFGYGQAHPNKFVRIHGTHNSSRAEMFRRYGQKWSFQYPGTVKQEQELNSHFMTELNE